MFEGFSPETVDFLWGIRMNNEKNWFTEHKQNYVNYLYAPMKALGQELFSLFSDKPGHIVKVSRIYRDARLHHPLPYKESLWICIRPQVDWWGENPCLYFEISPEGASYGFFLWQPRVTTLEEIRQDMTARPREFLELIESTQAATGLPITAELYKRPKEAPIPELAPYFAWRRCIGCVRDLPVSPELFGPQLAQEVKTLFQQLMPLYDYFCRFQV